MLIPRMRRWLPGACIVVSLDQHPRSLQGVEMICLNIPTRLEAAFLLNYRG